MSAPPVDQAERTHHLIEPCLATFPCTIGPSRVSHGSLLVPDETGHFDWNAALEQAARLGNYPALESLLSALDVVSTVTTRARRVRLVPRCDIGVSLRSPGRVLPYLFSNIVTCGRSGCGGNGATARRAAPSPGQLELSLGV